VHPENPLDPPASAIVDGEFGPIEGRLDDEIVFGRYRSQRTWSPDVVGWIARKLARGGTLLDVGAHIGLISIGVARSCPARCLAFEPAPDNHRLLCRNVERQGLQDRIEALSCALDAEPGRAHLALSADNSGDHRLLHHERARTERCVEVERMRLDDVLAQRALPRPIALKLDTQGAEARVLAGARASLPRIDHLLLEYWPAGLHRMGDRADMLAQSLCAHFPRGALLVNGEPAHEQSTAELLSALARFVPDDGRDQGFFDLVFSRG
jgi:FkbM family methyltransferase